ncbi:MAG: N-acetyl-gamma-glutamyl-phosphate reductase [Actinomycetes bacterium]
MAEPRVAVIGAAGFAGAVAARIIDRHPGLELGPVQARSDVGERLDALYPQHRVERRLDPIDPDALKGLDAAVVALPHGAAASVVAKLRAHGIRVIDLSADFRLSDPALYESWYGAHGAPELFGTAVYGLPELNRERIAGADLVACPGCYPTATLLGLAPLARAGCVTSVVVDAKSGVSGAGRATNRRTHFVSVAENMSAYGLDGHRHEPEIGEQLGFLGAHVPLVFVPHLVPLDQGELVTCYSDLSDPVDGDHLFAMYAEAYADEPFVEVTTDSPGVREVRETNICRITVRTHSSGKAVTIATIDNLWKGAASQAVQCLNLMFDLPETAGLK